MKWLLVACVVANAGCDKVFGLHRDPPDAPPPGNWAKVTAGDDFTCGIRVDGGLFCWGYNDRGQLGVGMDAPQIDDPVQVQIGSTWESVSAGAAHACAIRSDRSLWCWGHNWAGQLGLGTSDDQNRPTNVGTASWRLVAAGTYHTCGIRDDDSMWCWGRNDVGQVGSNSTMNQPTPQDISGGHRWSVVAAGDVHSCAIHADGTRWCWGENYYGHFGDGGSNDSLYPKPIQDAPGEQQWSTISAGEDTTCGVLAGGGARCWGANFTGQLGDGTSSEYVETPVRLASLSDDWVEIEVGATHACGRQQNGSVWCWGDASAMSLESSTNIPTELAPGTTSIGFALGRSHTCRLGSDHALWCAGDGSAGQLGAGPIGITDPLQVPGTWVAVDGGQSTTCAINTSAELYCWGENGASEVGDNTYFRRLTPTKLTGQWKSVSVGRNHSCALDLSDNPWCWGSNFGGSVGNNSNESKVPVRIMGTGPLREVSAGDHTLAVTMTNELWGWGEDDYGQLAASTPSVLQLPTRIGGAPWLTAAAGDKHSCGIAVMPPRVFCWGYGLDGELGNSAMMSRNTPVLTNDTALYMALFAGTYHTCAMNSAGGTQCWGENSHGQLGDGTKTDQNRPTPLLDGPWSRLALGDQHSCGIRGDGSLRCWGDNHRGQLGLGTRGEPMISPIPVGTSNTWKQIAAGNLHTCAIESDDSLWCWGDNRSGQLGTGTGWSKAPLFVP